MNSQLEEAISRFVLQQHRKDIESEVRQTCSKIKSISNLKNEFLFHLRIDGIFNDVTTSPLIKIEAQIAMELRRCRELIEIEGLTILGVIRGGTVGTLRKYLDLNPESIDVIIAGCSPLHHAVTYLEPEMVQLLIERGSKMIDTPDAISHQTPLMKAVNTNRTGFDQPISQMVKLLIRGGARAFLVQDNDGALPFGIIVCDGRLELGEWIIARIHHLEISIHNLLDTPDEFGDTVLHYAVSNGDPKIISTVIRWGSTAINTKNNIGLTPLADFLLTGSGPAIALEYGCYPDPIWEGVEVLRALGADPKLVPSEPIDGYPLIRTYEEYLQRPITEDQILELRFGVYFESSLTSRLLILMNEL